MLTCRLTSQTGRMLVVRYGKIFKRKSDALRVQYDLMSNPQRPSNVQCPVSYHPEFKEWLLLPRTDSGKAVRNKVAKRWFYDELSGHSIKGRSAQHVRMGECSAHAPFLLPYHLLQYVSECTRILLPCMTVVSGSHCHVFACHVCSCVITGKSLSPHCPAPALAAV